MMTEKHALLKAAAAKYPENPGVQLRAAICELPQNVRLVYLALLALAVSGSEGVISEMTGLDRLAVRTAVEVLFVRDLADLSENGIVPRRFFEDARAALVNEATSILNNAEKYGMEQITEEDVALLRRAIGGGEAHR